MATKYEMSKTYQYRKVMKPLLERKRRARINKCLDDLKDLMAERMQQESGDPNAKLEKADILELTVNHLRHMKIQRQQESTHLTAKKSFRSGYIHAANEVSRCLATLPNVNIALGTQLMTHLGLRLNQLESPDNECTSTQQQQQQDNAINKPLNVDCSFVMTKITVLNKQRNHLHSPGSSGYESDSDCSRFSNSSSLPMAMGTTANVSQGLLQMAAQVWRPW